MSLSVRDREIKKALETANRRMDKLEKEGLRSSGAYRQMQKEFVNKDKYKSNIFKGNTGKEKPRLRTDVSRMTEQEKEMALKRARQFNESRTSTAQGMKNIYRESKEKFERETGEEVDYDEYVQMWENATIKEFVKMYGSQQTDDLLKKMYANDMDNQQIVEFLTDNKGKEVDELYSMIGVTSYSDNKTFYSSRG